MALYRLQTTYLWLQLSFQAAGVSRWLRRHCSDVANPALRHARRMQAAQMWWYAHLRPLATAPLLHTRGVVAFGMNRLQSSVLAEPHVLGYIVPCTSWVSELVLAGGPGPSMIAAHSHASALLLFYGAPGQPSVRLIDQVSLRRSLSCIQVPSSLQLESGRFNDQYAHVVHSISGQNHIVLS